MSCTKGYSILPSYLVSNLEDKYLSCMEAISSKQFAETIGSKQLAEAIKSEAIQRT